MPTSEDYERAAQAASDASSAYIRSLCDLEAVKLHESLVMRVVRLSIEMDKLRGDLSFLAAHERAHEQLEWERAQEKLAEMCINKLISSSDL